MKKVGFKKAGWITGGLLIGVNGLVWAGSYSFSNGVDMSYKVTLSYAAAMRMKNPDPALIDGPIDPFQPEVAPSGQLIGFTHTGLPTTINFDDGNRNFRKHDLINNRVSSYGELGFNYKKFGAAFSGSAFYDDVFHKTNANDSPDTVNKVGPHNEFTRTAQKYNGERYRLLESYIYGEFQLGEEQFLGLRLGRQLVAWGESLFFPGIVSAQGPNDATKAFVPGVEIKEILLPVNQFSMQFALNYDMTLLGYYQLEYKATEVFPVGDYFSITDLVGYGAEFAYGSVNPAHLSGCPGLVGPLSPLCNQGGLGGQLLNASKNILVARAEDINPDKKNQWGVGFRYAITPETTIGLYHLNYHARTPTVKINTGFAPIGSVAGVEITTGAINQYVPVTYNIKYFDNIKMDAASWSTTFMGVNMAGEFIYRDGADTLIQTVTSGVLSPMATRSKSTQINVSAISAFNPGYYFEELALVGEASYLRINDVDPFPAQPGITVVGDGRVLFNDESAYAAQGLAILNKRNAFQGVDVKVQASYSQAINGNASIAGAFGSLFGAGDRRLGVGVSGQYLQNLEVGVGYNFFWGDAEKMVSNSTVLPQNPLADRDYATLNVKYNL